MIAAARAGCERVGPVRASAGYNGRGAAANEAGVEAALRNDAAALGGDAIVIRQRVLGAAALDALGRPAEAPRGAMTSGGCPNCVAITADAYRCPRSAPPAPSVASSVDVFARSADAALAAAVESARRCLPPGSRGGEAKARVTFAASGDVVYAEVEGEPFAGTKEGECVARKLRNAHVPAFDGESRSIERVLKIAP